MHPSPMLELTQLSLTSNAFHIFPTTRIVLGWCV